MMAAVQLAQCADPANCDLPSTLPWYFSLAMVAVWAAMVVGIVVVGVWLLRARADRRPKARFRRPPPSETTDVATFE